MGTTKRTITDLLPPIPSELSMEPPASLTIADLNLRPFFEAHGDTYIVLRPEVIEFFPQILPILKWVAESVKIIVEKQREKKSADVGELIRTLNVRIPEALASIALKNKYADKPNLLALFEGRKIPDDNQFRDITRKAIFEAVRIGILPSRRKLAVACGVNQGQLSNFVRTGSALGMEKVIECLNYVAEQALAAGRIEELKDLIFKSIV